jgi:hypothetical protein
VTPVIAHIAGFPVEETLGALGPMLLAAIGAGLATMRAHVRRWRQPPRA